MRCGRPQQQRTGRQLHSHHDRLVVVVRDRRPNDGHQRFVVVAEIDAVPDDGHERLVVVEVGPAADDGNEGQHGGLLWLAVR